MKYISFADYVVIPTVKSISSTCTQALQCLF